AARAVPLGSAAATALLDPGGRWPAEGWRDAVRRLRLPARRVLPGCAQRRHPALLLPPSHARRSLLPAWPAGPHRVGGFHRAGRSRRQRRLRLRRLLLAGLLPHRQRPATATAGNRKPRRRGRTLPPPPGNQTP